MTSFLERLRGGGAGAELAQHNPGREIPTKRSGSGKPGHVDPNVPKKKYHLHQRCLYERMMPGNAYISAHVNRLQHGFYESSVLHEPVMDDIYFASVHFVFHPQDPRSHRFKSAEIKVSVHSDDQFPGPKNPPRYRPHRSHPRILRHAPELMFGAVSPENLQWNFSLSSSLGVSQAPVSATLNPQGGLKGSYKVFHMMSIQGSVRSTRSPYGPEYDAEDAMAIWTLEENLLQRSGLPREFDFVLLVHKPEDVKNVYLTVDVDAEVEAWYGSYPQWYTNLSKYLPTQDFHFDFNEDIGQRFVPSLPGRGFNFASLAHALDEYVTMPGTVYPTNDTKDSEDLPPDSAKRFRSKPVEDWKAIETSPLSPRTPPYSPPQRSSKTPVRNAPPQNRHSWVPENVNFRVVLEHQYPQGSDQRRSSYSPSSNQGPSRYPSIRRRKSRSELKEYSAKQQLQDLAQQELDRDQERRWSGSQGANGHA